MNGWMMAGVWRHILRLPQGIGWRRVEKLAARAREAAGELSSQHREVHHFVVRELPSLGRPMPPHHVADSLDLPTTLVTEVLADLEAKKGFLFRNESGEVVWAYPVTVEPTPHRVTFRSGETLYAA